MKSIELIKQWMQDHPTSTSVLRYLVWVIFIVLIVQFLRKFLRKKMPDSSARYKSQKGIEFIGYLIFIFLTISYFTGNIKDFALAIGLLTAGITITLQELILSVAGSVYIFFVKVYKPGERIEINGIKGDVIDIDTMYTTMMEIGQWVSGDNYSGRIVKLSNAFVFRGPVYNYSRDFPFIWDEINLPIRYGSDRELAKEIIISTAQKELSGYVEASMAQWKNVVDRYYIEDAEVNPTLAITMTDNWMQFNLRYIVSYKKRRSTRNLLFEQIGKEIERTNGKVNLGSATVEVVKIPKLIIQNEP